MREREKHTRNRQGKRKMSHDIVRVCVRSFVRACVCIYNNKILALSEV